jgi:glycosyltransferase involved in cell wall biosynthesis
LSRELEKLELPFEPQYYIFSHRPASLPPPVNGGGRLKTMRLPMRTAKTLWYYGWGQKFLGLNRVDLFLAVNSELPPLSANQKKILVLHDFSGLKIDSTVPPAVLKRRTAETRRALEQSDAVLVYSRSTQNDLCLFFDFPKEKCRVVPLGVDFEFFSGRVKNHKQGGKAEPNPAHQPYFFTNGIIQPRKNLARLADAFLKAVQEANLPHHLLIAGGDGWKADEIKREIKALDAENKIQFLGYVSRPELAALYQQADGFLFPSLYEGFGLPVLEGMAAGTPVLTSQTSSLPEVAGDAALLIDPQNVDDIKAGILRLAGDAALAARLREKGRLRAAQFSFAQTARQTADLMADVLGIGDGNPNGPRGKN